MENEFFENHRSTFGQNVSGTKPTYFYGEKKAKKPITVALKELSSYRRQITTQDPGRRYA